MEATVEVSISRGPSWQRNTYNMPLTHKGESMSLCVPGHLGGMAGVEFDEWLGLCHTGPGTAQCRYINWAEFA